ncbi:DDX47 [Cordylochernes scorpioides]|uniref:DDX47 n=1 Tax=Cordylochernes scorpioides TaxID=51811 RepID=A0ABY6JZY4_9ARAC|nr:DDX47 [Cordylochernes scorpioides]
MSAENIDLNRLFLQDFVEIRADTLISPHLEHFYLRCLTEHKEYYLAALLEGPFHRKRVLMFCKTKFSTIRLHRILKTLGFRPLMLHCDMARANRNKNLRKFKEESQSYMVATDVAGRGMDFREVSAVINFDRPNVKEDYTRRVGRTAMAGNTGLAITLLPKSNKVDLGYMVKNKILKEFKLGMSEEEFVQVYQERTDNAIRIGNAVVAELKKEQENEQMKRSVPQEDSASQPTKKMCN